MRLSKEKKRGPLCDVLGFPFSKAASRGIKNLSSVEQKKRKQEEMEKRLESSAPGPEGGGLRVSAYSEKVLLDRTQSSPPRWTGLGLF